MFICNFTCRLYLVFAIFIGDLAGMDKTMKKTRRILRLVIHEKLFFLLEAQAARKKKIPSPCVIVKTAFPKNNNFAPKKKKKKKKRKYQSDPIRCRVQTDPKYDPIRSPIWGPIEVLLSRPQKSNSFKIQRQQPKNKFCLYSLAGLALV